MHMLAYTNKKILSTIKNKMIKIHAPKRLFDYFKNKNYLNCKMTSQDKEKFKDQTNKDQKIWFDLENSPFLCHNDQSYHYK